MEAEGRWTTEWHTSKLREAVNMLRDVEMLEKWADRHCMGFSKENCQVQCWGTNNSYAPVWAGCGLARKQHCREGAGIAHGKLVVLVASHLLGWLLARG